MNNKQKTQNNRHAVVIGASMAGLLAARALSEHFEQVTIIERDRLSEQVEPRKGVPQGRHVHILLAKGESILREYFPDFYAAFTQDGAIPLTTSDIQWFDSGLWKTAAPEPIKSHSAGRPFLETYMRRFLAERANVRFIDGCEVSKLHATEDHTHVTGVTLLHLNPQRYEEDMDADLVVDAGGRGSRTPQWLTSLGYDRVEETSVKIDVGYATRIYRRPRNLSLNWKLLLIYPEAPNQTRGGLVLPIEDDRWMVTLTGRLRDYPPDDETGFLEYARSLPDSALYYEVLHLLKTPTALFDPRIAAAVLRKEIAFHWRISEPPFFGTYPSSLFLSDIPVQGVVAALKQAQKQRGAASQLYVPAASTEVHEAGEEVVGASHSGKMEREGMIGRERELQTSQR